MSLHKTFVRDGKPIDVRVTFADGGRARAQVGDTVYELDVVPLPGGGVRLVIGGAAHTAFVAARGHGRQVRLDGRTYEIDLARGRQGAAHAGTGVIEAPMTGTVLDVPVAVGDVVAADQPVIVLQAMKMEHKLAAGVAGIVREIGCKVGEIVDQGRVLARVVPPA